ncbi:MAG: hypothetical protein RLN85_07130, partial [Pseudomonadales bacterium]
RDIPLRGGLNTYGYGSGNALRWVDPYGLEADDSMTILAAKYYGLCFLICLKDQGNITERIADMIADGGYEAAVAAQVGNAVGNKVVGDTGRVGVGGTPRHPTTWQHKLGSKIGPKTSRVGRIVGRASVVTTLVDGAWNLGTAIGCLAKCQEDLQCVLAGKR